MKMKFACFAIFVMMIWGISECNSTKSRLPGITTLNGDGSVTSIPSAFLTSTEQPSPVPTRVVFLTAKPVLTSTTTPVPTFTNTPIPTLTSIESENYIQELLENNGSCSLPCIWSITPGKTSSFDAINFFTYLGWKGSVSHGSYYTGRDLEMSSIVISVAIYPPGDGKLIEKVHVGIGGNDYLRLVKYLSFSNVLNVLGKPAEVRAFVGTSPGFHEPAETSFELLLYYDVQNILLEYSGTAVKVGSRYQICPALPNAGGNTMDPLSGNLGLYIGEEDKISTPEELVRPFWNLPTYYISSEKAFGMDRAQFFESAIQSAGNSCFYSEIDIWR